ncbi:MAG: hypothetical protein E6Q97_34185, partial [Desulfurellales bacterium]
MPMRTHVAYRQERESRALTEADPQDKRLIEAFSQPASKECILAHLMRATAHMPIKGTNKDSDDEGDMHTAFLLHDYTTRLVHHGVLEVDLFIGLEHFIEQGDNDFFPSYAKLHEVFKADEKVDLKDAVVHEACRVIVQQKGRVHIA